MDLSSFSILRPHLWRNYRTAAARRPRPSLSGALSLGPPWFLQESAGQCSLGHVQKLPVHFTCELYSCVLKLIEAAVFPHYVKYVLLYTHGSFCYFAKGSFHQAENSASWEAALKKASRSRAQSWDLVTQRCCTGRLSSQRATCSQDLRHRTWILQPINKVHLLTMLSRIKQHFIKKSWSAFN